MERKKINLFDPKYIISKPHDTLVGERVFYGDSLDDIAFMVNDGNTGRMGIITGYNVYDGKFFISPNKDLCDYVYFDPYYGLKKAWNDGEMLQGRLCGNDWVNLNITDWDELTAQVSPDDLRIKPEETWRPYKDFDEFLADVEERFPCTRNRPAGTMPFVWVKSQQNQHAIHLITGYNIDYGAGTVFVAASDTHTCCMMFNTFTYMDGTPFGKKE